MTPKVSVIIPVYQVERFLRRCLESVVNQTLRDIEIICVDDCSPDNSIAILEEYAKRDHRVRIIRHESNRELFLTRQTGIAAAAGEYCAFLDSDDHIAREAYETVYEKAGEENAEIAGFGGYRFEEDTGKLWRWGETFRKTLLGSEVLESYLTSRLGHSLCNRLYSTGLLKSCDFTRFITPFTNNEDALANLLIFARCRKYISLKQRYYYYRVNDESASRSIDWNKTLKGYTIGHGTFLREYAREEIFHAYEEKLYRFLYRNISYILAKADREGLHSEAIREYFKSCPEIAAYLSRRVNKLMRNRLLRLSEMTAREGIDKIFRWLSRKITGEYK